MKNTYFVVLLLLLDFIAFGQTSETNIENNSKTHIQWQANRKLTWDDFRGQPTISNEKVAAMTSTEFIVQTKTNNRTSRVEVQIENVFVRDESWVRNDKKDVPGLLAHEQGHFDLGEVHARQLRKKITYDSNIKGVENLIREAYELSNRSQDLYDHETNHGIDKSKQKEWLIYIASELKVLENYAK